MKLINKLLRFTTIITVVMLIYVSHFSIIHKNILKVSNSNIPEISIMYQKDQAELYPIIEIQFSSQISEGKVYIENILGSCQYQGEKAVYKPNTILQPDTTYNLIINIKLKSDEKIEESLQFTTKGLEEEQLWVEVVLGETQRVYIRKGVTNVEKEIICSGGTTQEPTIQGTYYLENRGEYFYSERFKEGALYWVRIKDQYLFHSIPRDENNEIILSEENKIGKPASHGCIRMLDEDAKWFYENVPDNTMVIIHD